MPPALQTHHLFAVVRRANGLGKIGGGDPHCLGTLFDIQLILELSGPGIVTNVNDTGITTGISEFGLAGFDRGFELFHVFCRRKQLELDRRPTRPHLGRPISQRVDTSDFASLLTPSTKNLFARDISFRRILQFDKNHPDVAAVGARVGSERARRDDLAHRTMDKPLERHAALGPLIINAVEGILNLARCKVGDCARCTVRKGNFRLDPVAIELGKNQPGSDTRRDECERHDEN